MFKNQKVLLLVFASAFYFSVLAVVPQITRSDPKICKMYFVSTEFSIHLSQNSAQKMSANNNKSMDKFRKVVKKGESTVECYLKIKGFCETLRSVWAFVLLLLGIASLSIISLADFDAFLSMCDNWKMQPIINMTMIPATSTNCPTNYEPFSFVWLNNLKRTTLTIWKNNKICIQYGNTTNTLPAVQRPRLLQCATQVCSNTSCHAFGAKCPATSITAMFNATRFAAQQQSGQFPVLFLRFTRDALLKREKAIDSQNETVFFAQNNVQPGLDILLPSSKNNTWRLTLVQETPWDTNQTCKISLQDLVKVEQAIHAFKFTQYTAGSLEICMSLVSGIIGVIYFSCCKPCIEFCPTKVETSENSNEKNKKQWEKRRNCISKTECFDDICSVTVNIICAAFTTTAVVVAFTIRSTFETALAERCSDDIGDSIVNGVGRQVIDALSVTGLIAVIGLYVQLVTFVLQKLWERRATICPCIFKDEDNEKDTATTPTDPDNASSSSQYYAMNKA